MAISPNLRTSSDSLNVSQGKLTWPSVASEAEFPGLSGRTRMIPFSPMPPMSFPIPKHERICRPSCFRLRYRRISKTISSTRSGPARREERRRLHSVRRFFDVYRKLVTDWAEDLVERLDFRDRAPEVIDLSPEGGVVKMLKESMIDCVVSDKVSSPAHRIGGCQLTR